MEHKKEQDQEDLVDELTPALHQEGAGDLTAAMETVVPGGDFTGTDSILHTRRSSHGILSSDPYAVEEERPHVADDPSILGDAPSCGKHEKTDEHDDSILD